MPKIRPATAAQTKQAELALAHLQRASVLLRAANAPKTLDRCLLTISSAKGALRHLRNRVSRTDSAAQDAARAGV